MATTPDYLLAIQSIFACVSVCVFVWVWGVDVDVGVWVCDGVGAHVQNLL